MQHRMELLAPAGDEAALRAAVCAGADAVYLGFARFGARAAAVNFDEEALEKAVAYAHLHHVRVHVTLNTLIKQGELADVFDALSIIAACRADAVIVQDMGVARMARECFPTLSMHASTQMALHTVAGARFAAAHGFSRVVLARECALDAIAEVAQAGIETEVFAHGALCAGVSGQCLLSSMAGGRSGNRGRCAQPCRQNVTLGGANAALLSMRDLCLRDYLPQLQSAGVASLKIEGRLKRAEYVAVVTGSYRKALDALARGEFLPADARENTELLQIYHRGGFTAGHAMGDEDAALCSVDRVGHGGVVIGKILSARQGLATASLLTTLNDGDSLRVEGAQDLDFRYSGPTSADVATLRIRPGESVRAGEPLVRMADAAQLAKAQNLTEKDIPITFRVTVRAGERMRLIASDGQSAVDVTGEMAQFPLTRSITEEEIIRCLSKLGDSPFSLQAVPAVETDGAFAPVSALNALRRAALEQLSIARRMMFFGPEKESRLTGLDHKPAQARAGLGESGHVAKPKGGLGSMAKQPGAWTETLAVAFGDASMGQEFLDAGANLLVYAPPDWNADWLAGELCKLPKGAWLSFPPQMSDASFRALLPLLATNGEQLAGVVLGSVGQLGFPIPLAVALGDGVPVTNRKAMRELLDGSIAFFTLWPELSAAELTEMGAGDFPCLLRVYGRERVMILNHCPEMVARGLTKGRRGCALCAPGDRACARPDAALTDRRGYRFPLRRVRMAEGCVIEAYNALPTDLSRFESRRREFRAGMLISFTIETAEEQRAIVRRFAAVMRGQAAPESDEPVTAGHFLRGIE